MVVDYRALDRVTDRRYFIIPNADGLKSTVTGSQYISVGDLKEGFNQVDNEPETAKKWLDGGVCLLSASRVVLWADEWPCRFPGTGVPDLSSKSLYGVVPILGRPNSGDGKAEEPPARAFGCRRCGRVEPGLLGCGSCGAGDEGPKEKRHSRKRALSLALPRRRSRSVIARDGREERVAFVALP